MSICPAGIVTGGAGGGIAPVCGFAGAVVLFVVAVCGLGLLQAMNTTSAAAAAPRKILSKTRINLPPGRFGRANAAANPGKSCALVNYFSIGPLSEPRGMRLRRKNVRF